MRRLSAAVVTVAVTGLVGACGTQSPSGGNQPSEESSGISPVANVSELKKTASAAMQEEQTVRIDLNTLGVPPEEQDSAPNFDCSINFTDSVQRCSGLVEFASGPDSFYFAPGETGPAGNKWVKVPVGQSGFFREMFGNPEQYTDLEKLLPKGSHIDGTEQVELDGTKSLRYDVTVDVEKNAEEKSAESGAEIGSETKKRINELKKAGKARLDYTMWVDSSGRPLKVVVNPPDPENSEKDLRIEAGYAWNEELDIRLPADQNTRELTPSEAEQLKQAMRNQQGQN
ncbi:hypothetical protein [Actinopolyspora saharensis]|uniref:Lipoprotein n=1 Tax=Actinopolyspora saharensis TaxID=995062 RepID=A0A1H1E6W9_9ACTN|nr:hypothetical protein [Actinopolyspora saharensis]SDQ84423.1 hypothetical protein SAMN04489718_2401 [Actinopolyspora saharensis]